MHVDLIDVCIHVQYCYDVHIAECFQSLDFLCSFVVVLLLSLRLSMALRLADAPMASSHVQLATLRRIALHCIALHCIALHSWLFGPHALFARHPGLPCAPWGTRKPSRFPAEPSSSVV